MTFGIITVKRNRLFRTERKNRFAFSTTGASSGPFVAGRTIIDLPRSDVDHELGGLAEVAGAFSMGRHGTVFACSGLSMQVALSRKNIQGGLALESRHKGAPGLGRAKGLSLF
jgi:hypothetical protein